MTHIQPEPYLVWYWFENSQQWALVNVLRKKQVASMRIKKPRQNEAK
ncbi:hypothetical protein [Rufibacter roseus]|uniref:Uncharacterized protein n=1 Tax=Rufibacter roseus TaxID=1567108 RepID=A0ABW2DJL8_9BACT|nr:hypothetical protein [Rufibacter roseus]